MTAFFDSLSVILTRLESFWYAFIHWVITQRNASAECPGATQSKPLEADAVLYLCCVSCGHVGYSFTGALRPSKACIVWSRRTRFSLAISIAVNTASIVTGSMTPTRY